MISYLFGSKIVRYIFSGGTAAVVNLGSTWLLEQTGMHYLVVVSVAFIASLITSFTLQKYLTFQNKNNSKLQNQFGIFTLIGLGNLLVNDLLVYIQVNWVGIENLVLDQAIASIIISIYSFFIYRWIFQKNSKEIGSFVK